MFRDLKALAKKHKADKIALAYEASTHGFCLHDDCRDVGIECFILAPTKMRKSKKDRKTKNDSNDAQLIFETLRGHLMAGNELPSIWIPDDTTRADRETVRARLDLSKKLIGIKTQVQTLMKAHRLKKPDTVKNSWTKPHRRWLRSLAADGWPSLATLLRQIEFMEQEIAILNKEIEVLSETERYREPACALVDEIVGVGLLTAMVFLTEMGDLRRFTNRRKVGAYLGLAPSSNESGENDDRKGHITREGPSRLRQVLCQSSWTRIAHDRSERKIYDAITKRNPKHKKIAVVAVMRRTGILMWHVGLEAQIKAGVFTDTISV